MGRIRTDDADHWAASLTGNGEAFGVLFDRHRDRVFRHAYHLVGQRHDAEDVTATAFLELWRKRATVRLVDGSVLPWLLVTTTNVSLNHRRSRTRYRVLLDTLPHARHTPDVLEEVLARNPLQSLEQPLAAALKSLTRTDRGLITLVALEGYTIAEAAAVLGLTPSAAKTRLHRARRRLQHHSADHPAPAGQVTVKGTS